MRKRLARWFFNLLYDVVWVGVGMECRMVSRRLIEWEELET